MDRKLLEGLVAMERFTRRFLNDQEVGFEEKRKGVLHVPADPERSELLRKAHLLVFDPAVYPEMEEQAAELLTPASPFFRRMMGQAESLGPMGVVKTARATPMTLFHFHVHLEGMNYEWEDIVTVGVDEDGDLVKEPPRLRELLEDLEGMRDGDRRFHAVDGPVDAERMVVPEATLESAPRLLKAQISPKLDELAGAIETGLKKTHERLHAYYEQMRDEIRRDEVKLRRRIGELNSRIWYMEDKLKLMRLEKEREVLSAELKEIKEKTARTLEHLAMEEQERMAKEAERARPSVRIRLVAATRVLPA